MHLRQGKRSCIGALGDVERSSSRWGEDREEKGARAHPEDDVCEHCVLTSERFGDSLHDVEVKFDKGAVKTTKVRRMNSPLRQGTAGAVPSLPLAVWGPCHPLQPPAPSNPEGRWTSFPHQDHKWLFTAVSGPLLEGLE